MLVSTLTLDNNSAAYQIRRFSKGEIQVNEMVYHTSIIITANQLIAPWEATTPGEINAATLGPIIAMKPDILLIGTGSEMVFLPLDSYGDLINHGIGVEVMNTLSACRTYNALTAENRHVAAALIVA